MYLMKLSGNGSRYTKLIVELSCILQLRVKRTPNDATYANHSFIQMEHKGYTTRADKLGEENTTHIGVTTLCTHTSIISSSTSTGHGQNATV